MYMTVKETKTVRIVLRDEFSGEMCVSEVKALWECPKCGERMGEPRGHNFFEDGDSYHCNTWTNPCGHVALYSDVKMQKDDGSFVSWREIMDEKRRLQS